MADLPEISKVSLPTGTIYAIKDEYAREQISALSGAMEFLGVTTTQISDGSSTNPIIIAGESVTAKAGDVVIYGSSEYVFSAADSKWHEFGSTGSLKALAFKDSASGSYQPAGSVSKPTFTGTTATISISTTANGTINNSFKVGTATATTSDFTPTGSVSQPSFTGTTATISISTTASGTVTGSYQVGTGTATTTGFKPEGTVSKPGWTGTAATISAEYQPAGSVSTPTITVTKQTTAVKGITSYTAGSAPAWSATVSSETLSFSWNAGSVTTIGSSSYTVMTGATASASQPTFTGTTATISTSYTPAGSVSQPTFTGTTVKISLGFEGSATTGSTSYQPAGTVSKPTFSGDKIAVTTTFSGTASTGSTSYQPAGSVSQPTFTGTTDTITVS